MLSEEIRNLKATRKELRKFGLVMGFVLALIAGILFWNEHAGFQYFIAAAVALAGAGLLAPVILKPLFHAWMTLAVLMNFVMTRVILTLMFYGVFTPAAILLKLLAKDPLRRKLNKRAATYWVKRPHNKYEPSAAEKMF